MQERPPVAAGWTKTNDSNPDPFKALITTAFPRIAVLIKASEVNFVDPFVRKGCCFGGTAAIIERSALGFNDLASRFEDCGIAVSRMRALVKITVTKALPLISPAYDRSVTESELKRIFTARFRKLQPNERFEE